LAVRAIQPGDRYLICSDGLSGFASADAIRDVLASGEPSRTADDLVALAYAGGAPDNVTVIVADVPDGAWVERDDAPLVAGASAESADSH
jgi:serine/threonine protein phosphatase PrpC